MAGLKYWVWLNECRGLTNRSRALLLDHFGSPEDVYYADEAEYALVEGLSKKQIELLADKSADGADKILGDCQRLGLRILTMQDADYPARLRGIFEPPCLLYVKGTLPAFDEEVAVAMVGTRSCTPYGTQSAEKIAYGLAKQGALVVSGAARGIDSAAHRGALRAGGGLAFSHPQPHHQRLVSCDRGGRSAARAFGRAHHRQYGARAGTRRVRGPRPHRREREPRLQPPHRRRRGSCERELGHSARVSSDVSA